MDVEKETMNERYLGFPVHVGSSKTKIFFYLKDKSVEENSRLE